MLAIVTADHCGTTDSCSFSVLSSQEYLLVKDSEILAKINE